LRNCSDCPYSWGHQFLVPQILSTPVVALRRPAFQLSNAPSLMFWFLLACKCRAVQWRGGGMCHSLNAPSHLGPACTTTYSPNHSVPAHTKHYDRFLSFRAIHRCAQLLEGPSRRGEKSLPLPALHPQGQAHTHPPRCLHPTSTTRTPPAERTKRRAWARWRGQETHNTPGLTTSKDVGPQQGQHKEHHHPHSPPTSTCLLPSRSKEHHHPHSPPTSTCLLPSKSKEGLGRVPWAT